MTSPDPKYFKNLKQRKAYLKDLRERFRTAIREADKKYPDVKIVDIDVAGMVTELLLDEASITKVDFEEKSSWLKKVNIK